MKFGSFGRKKDKEFIDQCIADPASREQLLRLTDSVHDLNDGIGTIETFMVAARAAAFNKHEAVREDALKLMARVSAYYPESFQIWRELAADASWVYRFAVACRLYWYVPDPLSDQLFAILRHDKSKRVREIAVSRYEWRPGPERHLIKMFDAELFDERIRRGEVATLCLAKS